MPRQAGTNDDPTTVQCATAGQPAQPTHAATAARECPGRSQRTAATQPNAASTTTATPPHRPDR